MTSDRRPDTDELAAAVRLVRKTLAPLDPAFDRSRMPTAQQREAQIDQIMADYRVVAAARPQRRPRPSRRRFLILTGGAATAGAAAVAGVLVAEQRRPRPAFAVTPDPLAITGARPPVTARRRLAQLAEIAAADAPTTHGPDGRPLPGVAVEHLVTDRWDLNSVIDNVAVSSAVIASRRQLWRDPENKAMVIDEYLPPQFPTGGDRAAWQRQGSPGLHTPVAREDYEDFPTVRRGRPPLSPAALEAWLRRGDPNDAAIVKATADVLQERVLTGPERAALLQVLARQTTMAYEGTSTDRAGRPGDVFTTTSRSGGGARTYLFVIDPVTAVVLAHEQILTGGAPGLRVRYPAVTGYRTYRTAEFVKSMP